MKATLKDVHIVSREVEIPEKCPECGVDLTDGPYTIDAWEYQDQEREGALDAASGHYEDFEGSRTLPEGGESFISYTAYHCEACRFCLVEGGGSESDVGDLPPDAEHARYTLDLWWEALRENSKLRCSYEAWVASCLAKDGVEPEPAG